MTLLGEKVRETNASGGEHWGLGDTFLQPREAAALSASHGFTDVYDLATLIAVGMGESHLGIKAWHDNLIDNVVVSRDCGWLQISIAAHLIGTHVEHDLYDPVKNIVAARALYMEPMGRGIRRFQPWAAYNSGVYLHDHYAGVGALAACNLAVVELRRRAVEHNDGTPLLPLPLFSTHELAAKLA